MRWRWYLVLIQFELILLTLESTSSIKQYFSTLAYQILYLDAFNLNMAALEKTADVSRGVRHGVIDLQRNHETVFNP